MSGVNGRPRASTDDWSYGFSARVSERQVRRASRRFARSRETSGRRSASSSAITCGCCASAPATIRGRIPEHPADVSRLSISRSSPTSTTTWWRAGMCTSRCSTGICDRATACTPIFDVNPMYERLFEPFEISPGRVPAAWRVPVHAIPIERGERGAAAAIGQRRASGTGIVLVGKRRAGDRVDDVQAAAAIHRERVHQPDVRAAARRQFHRAHLHVEHRVHGVAEAVVLEPHSIRQPVEKSGMAEPCPVDAAARQRFVPRVQSGVDSGRDWKTAACGSACRTATISAKFQYSDRF